MTILKFLVFLLILAVVVIFATLYRNDANLLQEPGISQRLKIFLTTNVAKTEDDHILPELRTPVFQEDASRLFGRIVHEATEMGWTVSSLITSGVPFLSQSAQWMAISSFCGKKRSRPSLSIFDRNVGYHVLLSGFDGSSGSAERNSSV